MDWGCIRDARAIKKNVVSGHTPKGIFFRHYLANGEQRIPLVLIMGYGGSLNTWPVRFIEQLSLKQEIIVFDNRGTGRSHVLTSESEFAVTCFANDLKSILDYLQLPKINLLGYSLGGCIALQFTQENIERVNRLILMSTTAGGALYTSPGEEILERLLNPRGSTQQEMFLDTFTLCLSEQDICKHKQLLLEIFQTSSDHLTPRITLSGQLTAYRKFDAQPFLSRITQAVKIIHGKNDRLTPIDNAKELARYLKNRELLILDNCEHCPHIEQMNRVIDEINTFTTISSI